METKRRNLLLFVGGCVAWALAVLAVLGVTAFAGLVWYRGWTPFMDDGPYHGRPAEAPEGRDPVQKFPLWDGLCLEVYEAPEGASAPLVAMRNADGGIQWCIEVFPDDYPPDDWEGVTCVESITFHDWRRLPFRRPRVRGLVDWVYGNEMTWWFLDDDGTLREFWYSW